MGTRLAVERGHTSASNAKEVCAPHETCGCGAIQARESPAFGLAHVLKHVQTLEQRALTTTTKTKQKTKQKKKTPNKTKKNHPDDKASLPWWTRRRPPPSQMSPEQLLAT
jgi:hypothetical protein